MPTIETERLILRMPDETDIDALDAMDSDPEVMRYIGDGQVHPRTREETAEIVANASRRWEERGYGWLAVTSRESGEFFGWVILAPPTFLPEIMPTVEIGYRFQRAHWGNGYAVEAAKPLLHHGFTVCGLEHIVSIPQLENRASRRVIEKLGLRLERETVVPANGQRVAVYGLSRAEYGT